ncbi:MAG: hypothetical protein LIO46_02600 [Clostridiales bacterium]|nr:hypothetical protein [Clostridiales bacterium]
MEQVVFKVSSVTNAQRGQKLLNQRGIYSKIERNRSPVPGEGCGYSIVANGSRELAERILRDGQVRIVEVGSR